MLPTLLRSLLWPCTQLTSYGSGLWFNLYTAVSDKKSVHACFVPRWIRSSYWIKVNLSVANREPAWINLTCLVFFLPPPTSLQFELDIEPNVFFKPFRVRSRVNGAKTPTPNGSQEFSFSGEPAPKGMQPLSETVSEFEMLVKAGKDTMELPFLHPCPPLIFPFPFNSFLVLAIPLFSS